MPQIETQENPLSDHPRILDLGYGKDLYLTTGELRLGSEATSSIGTSGIGDINQAGGFLGGGQLTFEGIIHGGQLILDATDAITINQGGNIQLLYGGDIRFTSIPAPTALTVALITTAGNIDAGQHRYKVTFVNDFGETDLGTASNTVTNDGSNQQNALTSIPIGLVGDVTSRKIYRTKIATQGLYYLLTTINDNTTTTYTDNTADAGLDSDQVSQRSNTTAGKLIYDSIAGTLIEERNTGFGNFTFEDLTSGYWNAFFGDNAGKNLTFGINNTGIGHDSLLTVTTGSHNTAVGSNTLEFLTTGTFNTAIGEFALGSAALTGVDNIGIGYLAGNGITSGSQNILIGQDAGGSLTTKKCIPISRC